MKRRRSRRPLLACSLLALVAACLAALAVAAVALALPERAQQVFGPPKAGTSPIDRIYLSARLLWVENDLTLPADAYGAERPFDVQLGESTLGILQRLEQEGLVANAEALRLYLVYSGLDASIQAGEYTLSPAMTPLQIAARLQNATPTRVRFAVLPGWRLEEVAAALPTSGLSITPEDFLAAAATPPSGLSFSDGLPAGVSLEGFLLPDTYELPRDASLGTFIQTILQNFDAQVNQDLRQGFERQGLSLYEGVSLASLVEREAVLDSEMAMIASVFLNRLAAGMKLDSDPTVQYALGFNTAENTWWTNPLSLADLQTGSPYNTYVYPGLPPGPIASPSLAALRAVAFPAQTPYYYFRAACDGSGRHTFAESYEEHLQNECP